MKKAIFLLVLAALTISPGVLLAWNNHALLTYPALKDTVKEAVRAEQLESFLKDVQFKLPVVLEEEEQWARKNIESYPPRPDNIKFENKSDLKISERFFRAIRLNPTVPHNLYLMVLPGRSYDKKQVISWIPEVSNNLPFDFIWLPYVKINPGQLVPALQVIATASDEPDYGQDMGLWTDSNTSFGNEYQYGPQPYGNPMVFYSTLVPFHISYYYESPRSYQMFPGFKKGLAAQRVHLYYTLSRLAFETGHPYWGYRFAGWAMHHLEDLTQPYHSTAGPGFSPRELKQLVAGIKSGDQSMLNYISGMHLLAEKIVNQKLQKEISGGQYGTGLLKALNDQEHDKNYPRPFSDLYAREVVAKESNALADTLGLDLKNIITNKKMLLEVVNLDAKGNYDAFLIVDNSSPEKSKKFNETIAELLANTGSHVRIFMKDLVKHKSYCEEK